MAARQHTGLAGKGWLLGCCFVLDGEIVCGDEQVNGVEVVLGVFGEGVGLADQSADPCPQRAKPTFHVVGLAVRLAAAAMRFPSESSGVHRFAGSLRGSRRRRIQTDLVGMPLRGLREASTILQSGIGIPSRCGWHVLDSLWAEMPASHWRFANFGRPASRPRSGACADKAPPTARVVLPCGPRNSRVHRVRARPRFCRARACPRRREVGPLFPQPAQHRFIADAKSVNAR